MSNPIKNDLFDNPMVTAALKAMSPEDIEKYKKIGESLYGSINFPTAGSENSSSGPPDINDAMNEALEYIEESIKAGLHPTMLEDNEIAILVDKYGYNWFEKFGYVEQDLIEISTVQWSLKK